MVVPRTSKQSVKRHLEMVSKRPVVLGEEKIGFQTSEKVAKTSEKVVG